MRERQCGECAVCYAVFGEHRFCPVCGPLTPLLAALDALAAEGLRLDVLADLEPAVASALREAGVLQRTYVDTIGNVVGIVDAMAEWVFRAADPSERQTPRPGSRRTPATGPGSTTSNSTRSASRGRIVLAMCAHPTLVYPHSDHRARTA